MKHQNVPRLKNNISHDQIWKLLLFMVASHSQPMFLEVMEGVQGCGHAKNADLAPGTGLEEQDETGNWKCQHNIFKVYFHGLQNRFNHEIGKNRNSSGGNLPVN